VLQAPLAKETDHVKKAQLLSSAFARAETRTRLGLNGRPAIKHNESFSFQVATADRAETDLYWNTIVGNGGEESECGWCKDKWGLSWQITPIAMNQSGNQSRCRQARVRCDDADEKDRHRCHRGSAPQLRLHL
jgi:predicted 3-demethylubiquinone-9 3-methyltransferase (glyoxalase superfamily)